MSGKVNTKKYLRSGLVKSKKADVVYYSDSEEDFSESYKDDEDLYNLIKFAGFEVDLYVSAGDNESRVAYAKAFNAKGEGVYIKLPPSDHQRMDNSNEMVKVQKVSIIPKRNRDGVYDNLNLGVSGAVFECSGEICILSREPGDVSPNETVLVSTTEENERLDDGGVFAYPVVNLSDLLKHPKETGESISEASSTIKSNAYGVCMETMEDYIETVKKLNLNTIAVTNTMKRKFEELYESLHKLGDIEKEYVEFPSDSAGREKYNKCIENIKIRNEKYTELISMCNTLSSGVDYIKDASSEMEDNNEEIINKYRGMMYVL